MMRRAYQYGVNTRLINPRTLNQSARQELNWHQWGTPRGNQVILKTPRKNAINLIIKIQK
jgi:hypothetical protein